MPGELEPTLVVDTHTPRARAVTWACPAVAAGGERSRIGRGGKLGRAALAAGLFGVSALVPGCIIAGVAAVAGAGIEREGSKTVKAEYTGLEGKSFAVLVVADRFIRAENPDLIPKLTADITERLKENTKATGMVPADRLLLHLYQNPRLMAISRGELAQKLGVERLIVIDLLQYQLTDPGNRYLWKGVAAGTVGIIEAGSAFGDEYSFQRTVRVTFPNKEIFSPEQLSAQVVGTALVGRFVDRASWLFYDHTEKNMMDY